MSTICSKSVFLQALALCRGSYQRAIVQGYQRISGSDLRGKARRYSGHYAQSRANLLKRLALNGIQVSETRGKHGLRILVLS